EALLPSTETFNCPIPQGPCPGMYIVVVNDPGDKASPNPTYNPNYLTASSAWDVWPGTTDQLDTPLDPISGTGCEPPVATPKQLAVVTAAGVSTTNGITMHVLGTLGQSYNPPVVNVAAPTVAHAIQNAINGAATGSLLVLQPGVYHENVILWKPLKLQGLGP